MRGSKPRRVRVHRKPRTYTGPKGRSGCVESRDAKSTKGWAAQAPSTGQRIRRGIAARCGASAFAVKRKDGQLKFPMVNPQTCCRSCKGMRVAYGRASRWKKRYPGVAGKIKSQAKRAGCAWAKGQG